MELVANLLSVFERLFGKILDDVGTRIYKKWIGFVNRKSYAQQLLDLPYVRYGTGRCYYGKCYDLNSREVLMQKKEYKEFFLKINCFSKKKLVKNIINNFQINCYDDSDKFFISLVIFVDSLTKNDITNIYEKHKKNQQAAHLLDFINQVSKNKPKLLEDYILRDLTENIQQV